VRDPLAVPERINQLWFLSPVRSGVLLPVVSLRLAMMCTLLIGSFFPQTRHLLAALRTTFLAMPVILSKKREQTDSG
jgi:hypothetical protein